MPSDSETAPDAPRRSTRTKTSSQVEAPALKKGTSNKNKRAAQDDEGKPTKGKRAKTNGAVPEGENAALNQPEVETKLKRIDIGDTLPSVILKNEKNEEVDVANLTSEQGVIMFLVPKANTPGCTNQACGFRDVYPDFTSSGFDVYCLSADKPDAQNKWQAAKQLPYPLLSDTGRVLISALGAGQGGKTQRSHFIFEKGGKLVDKKIPVKPADSPKLALEFVKSLNQA